MPHFYAHRVFGDLVWKALPEPLRQELQTQNAGFQLGLYGPDPLFFYQSWKRGPVYQEGVEQHRAPPRLVLERWRGHDHARGYALGWLCHYMLDAACHPLILAECEKKTVGHTAIELALDRRLMKKYPLPKEASFGPEVFDAAALGCEHATAAQFRRALQGFYRFSYTTAALYHRRGDPALGEKLMVRLVRTVPECVELCSRLADCLAGTAPLDWLPETDFNGQS